MAKKKSNQLEVKSIVSESNKLIEANYRFNVWEDRIFLMALTKIKPTDEGFKKYKIFIRDLVTEYGIKDHDIYLRIREAAETLRQKTITIPYVFEGGEEGTLTTGLLTSYGEVASNNLSYIVIELHPDLKPYLLQLKREFTQYNISFLMRMQSSHSRRIYKLLKQYQKIGRRKFSVSRLREMLCIKKEEYSKYYDFKRRLILQAQKDLAKYTDITFSFEEEKKGRRVEYITFHIEGKNTEPIKKELPKTITLTKKQEAMFATLQTWGITKSTFLDCTKERTEEHLLECISIVQTAKNVKNQAAYFLKLVKEESVINSQKVTAKASKAKKQKVIDAKQKEAQNKASEAKRKADQYSKEQALVKELLKDQELVEQVKTELSKSNFARYNREESFEENMKRRPVKSLVHSIVMQLKPSEFK